MAHDICHRAFTIATMLFCFLRMKHRKQAVEQSPRMMTSQR